MKEIKTDITDRLRGVSLGIVPMRLGWASEAIEEIDQLRAANSAGIVQPHSKTLLCPICKTFAGGENNGALRTCNECGCKLWDLDRLCTTLYETTQECISLKSSR